MAPICRPTEQQMLQQEVSRGFALSYCTLELSGMLSSLENRSGVARSVNQAEWHFDLNLHPWQCMTACHLLILQGDLKVNIFKTNKAGMFAVEKQHEVVLEILELK